MQDNSGQLQLKKNTTENKTCSDLAKYFKLRAPCVQYLHKEPLTIYRLNNIAY